MAINPGTPITYNDLYANFLGWLTNGDQGVLPSGTTGANLKNVHAYASDVHESMRTNGTNDIIIPIGTSFNFTYKRTGQVAVISSYAKIRGQLRSFLSDRHILEKLDQVITTKGALNFWNNIAAFCQTKLVFVTSSDAARDGKPEKVLMYDESATNFPDVHDQNNPEGELISASDVKDMLTNVEDVINSVIKTRTINNSAFTINSCSSSSSSSSSCSSSSSSSSSSSVFIAYMKI